MDQNILCEIDALLDTRLPSVARVKPEAAKLLVTSKEYWERLSDDFETHTKGMIRNKWYKERYEARDKDTLRGALATNMCLSLTKIFAELCDQRINSPLVSDVKLTINFYPYVLTDEEKEAYLTSISVFTNNEVLLEHVWLSPKEITPHFLEADYSAYILYDFNDWMSAQLKRFYDKGIPTVTVFAPARSATKDFTEEDITIAGVGRVSPFEVLEQTSRCHMNLQLLNIALFSPVI